ncbi:hypothetical protein CP556_11410 [Natrinema sp. CBA1119]|uniref:DUF7344 domain-containing protein n=1 Tax=Natrinema sp. CBA1119 TaxID=1608465 RepID=UPI000BF296B3|nr:hypothetical protein [Natrinema sp. CBA1119]PGF16665.1 hypothetical protein CP556_11410 [Natrinema sp. CBA1119]
MIDDDEMFEALADVRRRELLVELLSRERLRISKLTGISRQIAEADGGLLRTYLSGSGENSDADVELLRKRHVHLPKLASYGFIEWDRDNHIVTRGQRFEDMRPFLELIDEHRNERPIPERNRVRLSVDDR